MVTKVFKDVELIRLDDVIWHFAETVTMKYEIYQQQQKQSHIYYIEREALYARRRKLAKLAIVKLPKSIIL